jgi:cbb3-type cytochrome oxidase maturation protein
VSILYLMIPMGILIVVGAVWAFFWAVNSGQFDDLDSPAWRILLDDDTQPPQHKQAPGKTPGSDTAENTESER